MWVFNFKESSKASQNCVSKIRDVGNEQHDNPPYIVASRLLNENKDLEVAMHGLVCSLEQGTNGAYKKNDVPSGEEIIDAKSDCRDTVSC
ncbi:hypothetical protein PVK06_024173 [Gossypium arboreum]|uniref:Uncharacterized protein n=1 Tax=Gossypium arboreum TaxID=29729 RepID=A0ABR0PD75_GOSAR|nr:hypothetical protein PVK06_024173 [Gossypium arboreum]